MVGSSRQRAKIGPSCGHFRACLVFVALALASARALEVSTPADFIAALTNREPLIMVTQHMSFSNTRLPDIGSQTAVWGNCSEPLPPEVNDLDVPSEYYKARMCALYFDEQVPFFADSTRLWLSNLVMFGNKDYMLLNDVVFSSASSVYVVDSVIANTNVTGIKAHDSRVTVVGSAFVHNNNVEDDFFLLDSGIELFSYDNPNSDLLVVVNSYLPSAGVSVGVTYPDLKGTVSSTQTQTVILKGNTISETSDGSLCVGLCVIYSPKGQPAPPALYTDSPYGFYTGNSTFVASKVQSVDAVTWDLVKPSADEAAWLTSLTQAGVTGATTAALDPLGLAPPSPPVQYPSSPGSTPGPPPPPSSKKKSSNVGAIVGGVIGGLAFLVLAIVGFMYFKSRDRRGTQYPEAEAQKPYTAYGTAGAPQTNGNRPAPPERTTVPDSQDYAPNAQPYGYQAPVAVAAGGTAAHEYYAPGVQGVPAGPGEAPEPGSAWLPPLPLPAGSIAAGTPLMGVAPQGANQPYGGPPPFGYKGGAAPASPAGSLPPGAFLGSMGSMPNFPGNAPGSASASQNNTLSSMDTKTHQTTLHAESAIMPDGGTASSASAPRSRAEQKANDVEYLQQQLDALCRAGAPLASRYKVLPGSNERRVGGQGVVQFCSLAHDPNKKYAVKFFLDRSAFFAEHALYQNNDLRGILPPVDDVISNEDGHVNALGRPLPPMVVLEKGEALDSWAHRCSPDFPSCVQIIMHLVKRIAELHAKGYAHRDLKPSNCLFLFSNNAWTICDFGCCAPIGQTTSLSYTLAYAAPETVQASLRNDKHVIADPAVDVWALGVMFYELLTRTRVFPAGSNTTVQKAMTREIPLRWEDTSSATHATELRQLGFMKDGIMAMLQRDPEARTSLAEVQRMWKAVLGQETTMVAAPPGYGA